MWDLGWGCEGQQDVGCSCKDQWVRDVFMGGLWDLGKSEQQEGGCGCRKAGLGAELGYRTWM